MPENRDFKGVWIKKSIWLDSRLTALEKVVFAEIDSLDGDDGCYCSNKYLADFCQCSERKITDAIAKLAKLGYIEVQGFDGRRRVLRSRVEKTATLDGFFCESGNDIHYNINNKERNTYDCESDSCDSDTKCCVSDADAMFDRLWKLYPRKLGKNKVSAKSKRAIFAAGEDVVAKAIENYKAYLAAKGWGDEYTKQGSTFFNGDWQDFVDDDTSQQEEDAGKGFESY